MKSLITGASGFVGRHLVEELKRRGRDVVGVSRTKPIINIKYHLCDITDYERLKAVLQAEKPDEIYHLAGPSFVPSSYVDSRKTYDTIVNGVLNLYEAVLELELQPKILFVGSAQVYGDSYGLNITEESILHPNNPYSGAKACADLISEQYFNSHHVNIVRVRPFNHTGTGQSSDYVCSNFAKQIAELELNNGSQLNVGNLNVSRDFLDVRDVVQAYISLMQNGIPGEVYNVSSNHAIKIQTILEKLLLICHVSNYKIVVDENKIRSSDAIVRSGDNTKLVAHTGWKPKYEIDDTLFGLLEYWREKLSSHYKG